MILLNLTVFEWEWLAIIFDIYLLCSYIIWHGYFIIYFITLLRKKSAMEMFQQTLKIGQIQFSLTTSMHPPLNESCTECVFLSNCTSCVPPVARDFSTPQRFNLIHKHRYTQCLYIMYGWEEQQTTIYSIVNTSHQCPSLSVYPFLFIYLAHFSLSVPSLSFCTLLYLWLCIFLFVLVFLSLSLQLWSFVTMKPCIWQIQAHVFGQYGIWVLMLLL